MEADLLAVNEIREAWKSDKRNICNGVSFNVVKHCFDVLHEPLIHMSETTSKGGVLSKNLKIVRVTSLSKCGNSKNVTNYMSMSALPCFLKVLQIDF